MQDFAQCQPAPKSMSNLGGASIAPPPPGVSSELKELAGTINRISASTVGLKEVLGIGEPLSEECGLPANIALAELIARMTRELDRALQRIIDATNYINS